MAPGSDRAFAAIVTRAGNLAERVVRAVQAEGERQIVETMRSGQDPRGFVGRWDTGGSAAAIRPGPVSFDGRVARGVVAGEGPATAVLPVIEGGRRPGKPVSMAGRFRIRTWVKRKLLAKAVASFKSREAAAANRRGGRSGTRAFGAADVKLGKGEREEMLDNLTFLVVRAIRRRGTPGLHPFAKAAAALRAGKAAEIWRRVTGGAR